MKPELRRIEATLQQLSVQPTSKSTRSVNQPRPLQLLLAGARASRGTTVEVTPQAGSATPTDASTSPETTQNQPKSSTAPIWTVPLKTNLAEVQAPALPRFKLPSFSSHRNAANPGLAMNLLKEIEIVVAGWQTELQQVLRKIQDIYLEGPIIDGWLESYTPNSGEVSAFRHADADCLIDYVEKMQSTVPLETPGKSQEPIYGKRQITGGAGYRLCGLNEDGQLWFRPCPAAQLPAISLAISRYQRLKQLLVRKQDLELKLGQLSEALAILRGRMPT